MPPFSFPSSQLAATIGVTGYLDLPDLAALTQVSREARESHETAYTKRKVEVFEQLAKFQHWQTALQAIVLQRHHAGFAGRNYEVRHWSLAYCGRRPADPCRLRLIERLDGIRYNSTSPLQLQDIYLQTPPNSCPMSDEARWINGGVNERHFTFVGLHRYGVPAAILMERIVDGVLLIFEGKGHEAY